MKPIVLDREDMSDFERGLFLKDLQKITDEYFETDGSASLEITRTEEGFIVCIIFTSRRIKSLKQPI